ncbi:MAG: helix-turn-helix domain-containing protein [Pseudomonadota bacterium]
MTDRDPETGQFTEGNGAGEWSKYDPDTHPQQAAKLCELGATDQELADFFEVHVSTIYRWRNQYAPFCEAVTRGKEHADERVVRSLFQRAVGYEHGAVKIFMPQGAKAPVYAGYKEHVPADVGAAMNWLTNRQPKNWKSKQSHEHTGNDGGPIEVQTQRIVRRAVPANSSTETQPSADEASA